MTAKAKAAPEPNGRRAGVDFPKHTLEAVLKVPQSLEEKNGGNPMPPMDVALAINMSPGSSAFRDLLSSSIKYGLTSGSFNQPKVTLEAPGKAIVAPTSPEERQRSLFEAALRPDVFRRVYEYYRGKKLPESQFFANTLVREFNIPKDGVDRFVEVFTSNVEYLGLVKDGSTGKWLSSEMVPLSDASSEKRSSVDEAAPTEFSEVLRPKPVSSVPMDVLRTQKNAIFIGHGKDKGPLEQLKKILDEYHLPYKVAEDEANKGRPISQKVADTMRECGAAILIFTADEEFTDKNGNAIYRPSENVVFELGAAGVLYDARIIIFRDSRVQFPSNFKEIGYMTFDAGQLSAKAVDLFRELIGFGLIKISVA
jgi:Predicted nucleotide-binding protein containing TIR-like domain